jgi:hypothetical protein
MESIPHSYRSLHSKSDSLQSYEDDWQSFVSQEITASLRGIREKGFEITNSFDFTTALR